MFTNARILSVSCQSVFWLLAFLWLWLAGNAGSPQPDNWLEQVRWMDALGWVALLCLCVSVACGVIRFSNARKLLLSVFFPLCSYRSLGGGHGLQKLACFASNAQPIIPADLAPATRVR